MSYRMYFAGSDLLVACKDVENVLMALNAGNGSDARDEALHPLMFSMFSALTSLRQQAFVFSGITGALRIDRSDSGPVREDKAYLGVCDAFCIVIEPNGVRS